MKLTVQLWYFVGAIRILPAHLLLTTSGPGFLFEWLRLNYFKSNLLGFSFRALNVDRKHILRCKSLVISHIFKKRNVSSDCSYFCQKNTKGRFEGKTILWKKLRVLQQYKPKHRFIID